MNQCRGRQNRAVLQPHVFHLNHEAATLRHSLSGVDGDVLNYLRELAGVDIQGPEVVWEMDITTDRRSGEGKDRTFSEQILQRNGSFNRFPAVGKGQELLSQRFRAKTSRF